jgi:NAD(P)-dependent dehydrogenase (short-subunit alcohol dehydrogenase family)
MSQTVLITGANRGLGFQLARLLLQTGGYRVVAAARSSWKDTPTRDALESCLEETRRVSSKRPTSLALIDGLDVASPISRLALAPKLQKALGTSKLDILVNNAGVYPTGWTAEAFAAALATNTIGPLRLAQELTRVMSDGAHVINVSSGLGQLKNSSQAYRDVLASCKSVDDIEAKVVFIAGDANKGADTPAYNISKAALNRGTQILAEQWKGRVRLTSVDPGWCATDMGGKAATRTPRDGAESIYRAIVSAQEVVPSGSFLSSAGKPQAW